MHRPSVLAVVVTVGASLSTALGKSALFCDEQCSRALGYLAGSCRAPLLPTCLDDVHSQALKLCSSYLSPTSLVTVTQTDTAKSTIVQSSTTTTGTTTTELSTSTTITTSTVTTTTYIPPPVIEVTLKRRGAAPTACPDLSTRTAKLTRRPSKLSSFCSRLGVTAPTATTTELTTSTALQVSTSVTTFTSTTVTTTSTVATTTATVNYCDASMSVSLENGNGGSGNVVLTPGGSNNANECCRLCWGQLDCVASSFNAVGQCQLLVKSDPATGGPVSPQCPLGVDQTIVYVSSPEGNAFRGPCGPLL